MIDLNEQQIDFLITLLQEELKEDYSKTSEVIMNQILQKLVEYINNNQ